LTVLLAGFGLALALTYAWVVPRLVLDTEDTIFAQQLERLRVQAAQPGASSATLEAPGVRVIRDLEREGPQLAGFLGALAPGVHEFWDEPLPGLDTTQLLVAVEADASGRPVRWLLYDLAGLEALEGPWSARYLGAVGGGFALALLATLVALLAARRLFGALADLRSAASRGCGAMRMGGCAPRSSASGASRAMPAMSCAHRSRPRAGRSSSCGPSRRPMHSGAGSCCGGPMPRWSKWGIWCRPSCGWHASLRPRRRAWIANCSRSASSWSGWWRSAGRSRDGMRAWSGCAAPMRWWKAANGSRGP
jgi:hypothetical protein